MSPRAAPKASRNCAARSASSPARSPPSPKKAAADRFDASTACNRTAGVSPAMRPGPRIVMPLASRRARRTSIDIWPGFVDALAQLLMVIIFILLIFTAGQFLLSDALSGRDRALQELQQQVSEL